MKQPAYRKRKTEIIGSVALYCCASSSSFSTCCLWISHKLFYVVTDISTIILPKTKFLHALYTSCFMILPLPLCEWARETLEDVTIMNLSDVLINLFGWELRKFKLLWVRAKRQNCWVNASEKCGKWRKLFKILSIFSVQRLRNKLNFFLLRNDEKR